MGDDISFEYLNLKKDGTGFKGCGQTIKNEDTLFEDDHTALKITNWYTSGDTLFLFFDHQLIFDPLNIFLYKKEGKYKFEVIGEHFKYEIYPSHLNRAEFKRSVTYEDAAVLDKYGLEPTRCIIKQKVFTINKMDKNYSLVEYKGFENIINSIVSCKGAFSFPYTYEDPPYELKVLTELTDRSTGMGVDLFDYCFMKMDDSMETSIVIYYDFKDRNKNHFFEEVNSGKEKTKLVKVNGKNVYLFKNWQKKYSGKVFYKNHLFVAYYTKDKSLEKKLRKCIASFKYKTN
jgi:hypothetical protein